jgi:hypothetical protein
MSGATGTAIGPYPGPRRLSGFRRWTRWDLAEAALAVAAFAVLCVVILRTAPFMLEPDDYAYQGSIVGMTDGHFLSLSSTQYYALVHQLGKNQWVRLGAGPNIASWVQLPDGRWISQKDPGFPFLAVVFRWAGVIRWDQLFYGAIACAGLFAGARRWLGRFGGAAAVGLYCSSAAAMLWGWMDYMPTFTDASLIAAGAGALLWAVLAAGASARRRTIVGLAGFVCLEAAAFTRYTDAVVLGCAVIAVLADWSLDRARLPRQAPWWWLGSALVFGIGVATFNDLVYGGPLKSAYPPGLIQFSLSAIWPNLKQMPAHLMQVMPLLVPGLLALAWMIGRWAWLAQAGGERAAGIRRDLAVGLALAACWLAVWGLYSAYTWTVSDTITYHVARFYVPALGPIALLGAWLITRAPWREPRPVIAALAVAVAITVMFWFGISAFNEIAAARP